MRALFRKKKRVFLLWVFCSKRELLSTQKLLSFSVFKEKGRKTTTPPPPQTLFFISNSIAFSVSVGIILYIHTSSIERREKERLAKEKASSSSRSDFEEEEE
jgi:hypothetical protein